MILLQVCFLVWLFFIQLSVHSDDDDETNIQGQDSSLNLISIIGLFLILGYSNISLEMRQLFWS